MTTKGTNEAERGLNVPKSEEELAEQILAAVSDGNNEDMDRLFSVELQPDAASEEEEDSNDSPDTDEEEEAVEESDGQADEEDSDAGTTTQELTPAEERLAQLEQKLAAANAAVGRMASMQSRLAQLERELKKQPKPKSKEEKEAEEAEAALDERINKLAEIDPDTADILKALRQKAPKKEAAQEPVDDGIDPVVQEEYFKVLQTHTDADAIFKHPYWHMWKEKLSPEQRAWAESSRSDQVIVAINHFKEFVQGFGKTAEAPAAVDVVDTTKLNRERKLLRSADSSDKPVKKSPKFDEDSFFQESYAQIAKEAGISY